jgi:hypothetical protein
LEESKKKSSNQRHPNEIPHQEEQISYLLNLHRNAQQRVEQDYQTQYGTLTDNTNKEKPTNYTPLIIGGCVIAGLVLIGAIALLTRKNKKIKK